MKDNWDYSLLTGALQTAIAWLVPYINVALLFQSITCGVLLQAQLVYSNFMTNSAEIQLNPEIIN